MSESRPAIGLDKKQKIEKKNVAHNNCILQPITPSKRKIKESKNKLQGVLKPAKKAMTNAEKMRKYRERNKQFVQQHGIRIDLQGFYYENATMSNIHVNKDISQSSLQNFVHNSNSQLPIMQNQAQELCLSSNNLFKNMEDIHKEEPEVSLDRKSPSLLFIKEETLDIKEEDLHDEFECTIYSGQLDTSFKKELDGTVCVKLETTIKNEISKEQLDVVTQTNSNCSYRRRLIPSIKKNTWLKGIFQKLNRRLFTSNRKTLIAGGYTSSTDQNVLSSRNECFSCYFCMRPFLVAFQCRNHLIRRHVVVKRSTTKNVLKHENFGSNLDIKLLQSGAKWKDQKVCSNQSTQEKLSNKKALELQKCNICSKIFETKGYLKLHMRIHTGVKLFNCELCSKKFSHKNSLIRHVNIHTGIKLFKCGICSKEFIQRSNLNSHMKVHTGIKPFKCENCSRKFAHKTSLISHMYSHTGVKPIKCETCSRRFTHKNSLIRHMSIHTGIKPFKCDICSKEFTQEVDLNSHTNIHTGVKPFKCEMCPRKFVHKKSLIRHIKVHSGIKSFKCEICSKKFIHKKSLIFHMNIHTDIQPFKCDICKKVFTQKAHLNKHLNIHKGIKHFKCDVCLREFTQKAHLDSHMSIHTGIKPFKCDICSKEFTMKVRLDRHVKIHTGIKPFKCETCSKRFTHRNGLTRHLKVHTDMKPFKCDICLKDFTWKANLNKHKSTCSQNSPMYLMSLHIIGAAVKFDL